MAAELGSHTAAATLAWLLSSPRGAAGQGGFQTTLRMLEFPQPPLQSQPLGSEVQVSGKVRRDIVLIFGTKRGEKIILCD
jgi:hypothetical protein